MNGFGMSPELLQRLAGSLLHFLWQGALLALIAIVTLRLMARRSAESRYIAAVVAMALMTIAPVVTFVFYAEAGGATLGALQLFRASVTDMAHLGAGPGALKWATWIVVVWTLGVGFCSTRLIAGWFLSRRIIRAAKEAVPPIATRLLERVRHELLERRTIRLLVGTKVDTPVVFGWIRPIVLLPVAAVTGLPEDQLLAVLAHELAHIRRHDFLVNSLQRAVECVLFYHPAVWWISGRIRMERERCCDDLAVRVCGDNLVYARALITLEKERGENELALAIPAVGNGVTDRIRRLLGLQSSARDWQSAVVALLFLAILAGAGTWRPALAEQSQIPSAPPSSPSAAQQSKPVVAPSAADTTTKQPIDTIAQVREEANPTLNAIVAIATAQAVPRTRAPLAANPEAGILRGQVRGGNNSVASAGTWVRAILLPPQGRPQGGGLVEIDSQGRYELVLRPGRYTISIEDYFGDYPGGAWIVAPAFVAVVEKQGVTNLDLNYPFAFVPAIKPEQLQGRVVFDDGGGLPVGTLRRFPVVLTSASTSWSTQPFTNTQGVFAFPVVPGEYAVKVAFPLGYYVKSMTYGNVDLTRNTLTLKPGADTKIQVVLTKTRPAGTPPGVKVSGRIRDWAARAERTALALRVALTSTDLLEIADIEPRNDGSFEIEGVPPGSYDIWRVTPVGLPAGASFTATAMFDVGVSDVPNLALALDTRGRTLYLTSPNVEASISGIVEPGSDVNPKFEVEFTVASPSVKTTSVTVSGREFSAILPEGEYRVRISGLPQGYTLKSITAGPLDLTEPFLVTSKGIADKFTGAPIKSATGITIRLNPPPPAQ